LPAYRDAYRAQRCLVLVSAFYEWRTEGKRKLPFMIHREDGKPFAIAGLWSSWTSRATGEVIDSCSLLTRSPAPLQATVHDRMPVILAGSEYGRWIDPNAGDVTSLLEGHAEGLALRRVSSLVNKVGVNDPRCIEAVEEGAPEPTSLA
jgi:putative SOS response-associated peptidase YedK